MWMLVRAGAELPVGAQGDQVLAACPDSPERGDPWRWSVTRVGAGDRWSVSVDVEPAHVRAHHEVVDSANDVRLDRAPGEEIVVVGTTGRHLVQDTAGPWHRWLERGDVFVVEGEDPEALVLSGEAGARVSIVRLTPTGGLPLRWVP